MLNMLTTPSIEYTQEYFYGVSLIVAAIANLLMAGMLHFDSNNYLYTNSPNYLRSRRLTSVALAVFGIGFLLHWWFMPHYTNRLAATALSLSYFHIGGVLFSMSHTSLIDRHYLTRRVVVRDVTLLLLSLMIYWGSVVLSSPILSRVGFGIFFLHITHLTAVFYHSYYRINKQLDNYAEYLPNDADREVRWLLYSCHIIILFGIGSNVFSMVFQNYTWPFSVLLTVAVGVFGYIYKALDSFGIIAYDMELLMQQSDEYNQTEQGRQHLLKRNHPDVEPGVSEQPSAEATEAIDEVSARIEQWVAERRYTDPKLTFKDVLEQIQITEKALNYYLERQTTVCSYRQWLPYLRIEEAKRLMLLHPDYTLQAIAQRCGYASNSNLTRMFKAQTGLAPMEWLKKELEKGKR